MDPTHGLTIHSTGRAYLIRTVDSLSSTVVACALIWGPETTPVPKEDFATRCRQQACFGTPLPILVTMDSEVMPVRILVMVDFAVTPRIPAMADFGTMP